MAKIKDKELEFQKDLENMNSIENETAQVESVTTIKEDGSEEAGTPTQDNLDMNAVFEQKIKEQEEKYLRLQADFDNFRKRSQKEKQGVIALANKDLLLCVLPIIDNLERAIASSENPDDAFTKGVDMVYKQLLEELKKQGVTAIEAVNQEFDPKFHQAVAKEASDDVDSNIVIQEFQKGYLLKDEVLRPTMVKVSE